MSTIKSLGVIILINAVIIAFYLFAPLNPKIALFAAILLTFNYIFYRLFSARAGNDLSKLEHGISPGEVSKGVKLLRYAACALAFVSFITTAQGMSQFVFKDVEWQAYLVSFAVQSILIIFSLLFFHFYVSINSNNNGFPRLMSRFITYCVVLLFTLSLIVSSTFSFVYIANNTYASMRAKNNNIIIESFLNKEISRLRSVNEEIGKREKATIEADVKQLAKQLTESAQNVEPDNEKNLRNIVDQNKKGEGSKYLRDPNNPDEADSFFTESELLAQEAIVSSADYEEYKSAYEKFKNVKSVYDTKYDEYKQRFDIYSLMLNPNTALLSYTVAGLQSEVASLNNLIKQIAAERVAINKIREKSLNNWLEPYRLNADLAFDRLNSDTESLISFYEIVIPALEQALANVEKNKDNKKIISDLYSLVTANEYDETAANDVQTYLNQKRAEIALGNQNEELDKWITFSQHFNSFLDYSRLQNEIDDYTESDLSISYYILGKDDQKPGDVGTIKYVSEEEWEQIRKEDFVEFTSLLKKLPDLEQYRMDNGLYGEPDGGSGELYGSSKAIDTDIIDQYDPDVVLETAYQYNRDLLEDINNIEKAFNYFKYNFRTMAVFSLALALFMDFASFLTGSFMFATTFFRKLDKKKQTASK